MWELAVEGIFNNYYYLALLNIDNCKTAEGKLDAIV